MSSPTSVSRWRGANRGTARPARSCWQWSGPSNTSLQVLPLQQKITVRTDNSAVSWLHRSKDPGGQPARWIEVIDTYDITFQHRPGRKHGNADALSRYPCRQCGGDCEGTPVKPVRAVTKSQRCEPGCTSEEMAAGQDADPDIGPIMQWKRARDDPACWEDIVPESRETKVLWRQWERLHLVHGVLHHRFYELEGQGWRHQLVVPEDQCRIILQRLHAGAIGAHLGTALVYEIVAQYGAFRKLHSDQGTNFGSEVVLEVCRLFGIHKTRTTPYHPRKNGFIERSFRTLGRCKWGAGRRSRSGSAHATLPDELPGYASSQHGGDPQHDDAWPADMTSSSGHVRDAPGAGRGGEDGGRVCHRAPGGLAGSVPT